MRLVLLDADPSSRAALAEVLRLEGEVSLLGAVDAPAGLVPHLAAAEAVLMVFDLASEDPTPTTRWLREYAPEVALVVLSPDVQEAPHEVPEGAQACLLLAATPRQIVAAARGAIREMTAGPSTGPLIQQVPHAAQLTPKEREVMRLVERGATNQQIADQLYLSVSAVKSHLSHVFGRLGVGSRDGAVAEARRQGVL